MSVGVGERLEDLLERVQRLASAGRINQAAKLVMTLADDDAKLILLRQLAGLVLRAISDSLAHSLAHDHDLVGDLALAYVLVGDLALDRADTFARVLVRDLDFVLDRALTRARARVLEAKELIGSLNSAVRLNAVVARVLKQMPQSEVVKRSISRSMQREITAKLSIEAVVETLILEGIESLTPGNLGREVAPYLQTLIDLQRVISQIKGDPTPEMRIWAITQNSPLGVDMDGVGGAIQSVKEDVVPWRREHAQKMAALEEARAEAEMMEVRTRTTHMRVEMKQAEEEVERKRLENERLRLELQEKKLDIERKEFELYQLKVELALSIVQKISPQMSEAERFTYVMQLLKPLNVLTDSKLEIQA